MLLFKVCSAVSLLAILSTVTGQLGPSGSGSGDCDPCSENECPRFLNADCTAVNCIATFIWRGNDVTDRCDVTTCDTRECPANRDCIETVVPPSCPPVDPPCRQYVRSSCQLRPPTHPMTCDDIECDPGLTCRRRDRPAGFRTVLRCVPV